MADYIMYGAEFSLYSGKLRSYLRKKGIAFTEKAPSIVTYKRFIVPRTGVHYIPVLQTPEDEVLQDTTEIIDAMEARHPERAVYPPGPRQKLAALLLEVYGDEWLLIPAMHYRWHFPDCNLPFLHDEFGTMLFPWLPRFLRRRLGRRAARRFAGIVPKLGVTDRTVAAIEASYTELLSELEVHFSHHAYLFGDRPSIGDFGLIGPFYAHLYRDPYPGKRMRKQAPAVAAWVERMLDPQPAEGTFPADDAVPETLLPVLRRMAREQMPVLADTVWRLAEWHAANPERRKIPRTLGEHEFEIGGIREKRLVLPYSLWMWQRPRDHFDRLGEAETRNARGLLQQIGAEAWFDEPTPVRVDRRDNRYVVAGL